MSDFESLTLYANGLEFSALARGTGPMVICLHGFPDTSRSFRHQMPVLAKSGYRVISPSLRGYEPASQPSDGDYTMVRMAEDLIGWIDHLGNEPVHLVGHDWGGIIAYVAAALAPDRFHAIATLAVPHPNRLQSEGLRRFPSQLLNSWYMMFFQLRGVADLAVETRNWAMIEKLWRDWSPGWRVPAEEMEHLKATLSQPGVKSAALGYYRAMVGRNTPGSLRTLELFETPIHVPTLAITGALDGCIDTRLYDVTMKEEDFPGGLEVMRIEGVGHFLHQEHPEEINRILIDWLERTRPGGTS
ncbi:alpha/beta hydrolase [Myxococcota bacterium]|nr:alpha/beta hydrolase [Myxococcota bacterium]